MAKIDPVIYDEVQHTHTPAPAGSTLAVSYIPLSVDSANVITKDDDGVLLKAEDLVSKVAGNIISVAGDKKLYAAIGDLVSADTGNIITYGTDNKLFAVMSDVLSVKVTNVLKKDASGKILLEAQDLISADKGNGISLGSDNKLKSIGISEDGCNCLHKGEDGGLYISAEDIVSHDSMSPFSVCNGKLYFDVSWLPEAQTIVSGNSCNLIQADNDGAAFLKGSDIVSTDTGNYIHVGCDGKLYAGYSDVVSALDANLLQDDGSGKVLLTTNRFLNSSTNNLISLDDNGKMLAKVALAYDNATGRLDLTGTNGGVLSTVTIPTKTSVLKSADIVVNPIGQPAGTFIKFVFTTEEGETVSYANLKALTNIYKGGTAVDVTDYTINVKYGKGIKLVADKLTVDMDRLAGNGLMLSNDVVTGEDNLAVNLGNGLDFDDNNAIEVVLHPDQQVLYASDNGLAAFFGMHTSTANGSDVLECYDHNGDSILSTRITLGDGLEAENGSIIKVKTVDALTAGDKTPVNSDAVLAAIDSGTAAYDNVPTSGSSKAVKSDGIFTAIKDAKDIAAADDALLEQRIVALEDKDTTPTKGSTKAVTSNGVYTAIETAKEELTVVDDTLSDRIDALEQKDSYQVRTNSDATNVIYLCGSVSATPTETYMFYNPNVYLSGNTFHADKFDGKVEGSNVTGDVTARLLKSYAFEAPSLTSDRLSVVAPGAYSSYRVWGFVRCLDGNGGTEDIYVSGTYAGGAKIVTRTAGKEVQDPTGDYAGFSYRNLNCLPLA